MGSPRKKSAMKPTGTKKAGTGGTRRVAKSASPSGARVPPTQPAETLRILSPRNGDVQPWQFTVTGTYSLPSSPLTLSLSGVIFATVPLTSNADGIWSKSFTASMDGKCNATASATGASADSVDFEVRNPAPLTIGNPSLSPPPPPLMSPAGSSPSGVMMTVTGEHRDSGTPPTFVRLLYSDETQHDKKMADHPMSGKYKAQFTDVESGLYIVLAESKVMGKAVHCSRVKDV